MTISLPFRLDGYYKLTVDLNALTLLVEQGDPTAIEEVSAAVKPVVTVSGSTIQVLTNGAVVDDVMVFDLLGTVLPRQQRIPIVLSIWLMAVFMLFG